MNLMVAAEKFTSMRPVIVCECEHKLQGTGSVFFQSTGLIYCSQCCGWQLIRKPVK